MVVYRGLGGSVMKSPKDEKYSPAEATRRLEAALRGAREVGHKPMKEIGPKRSKAKTKAKEK